MAIRDFLREYGYIEREMPPIAKSYSGNIVVCGDAACIWDDLERFGCRSDRGLGKIEKQGWDFMTINKMVEVFPGNIEHCYSNSPECLRRFIAARRDDYVIEFNSPKHTHSHRDGCDHRWPYGGHGTSGLGGTFVAVCLGYARVVLAGMPLDDGHHNGEPHWRRTGFASSEAAGSVGDDRNLYWKKANDLMFEGKVRSLSGRTKAWLGDAMEWA